MDNGFQLEEPVNRYGIEKLRILASHGSVITLTRDSGVKEMQNKYTTDPSSLPVDAVAVWVDNR